MIRNIMMKSVKICYVASIFMYINHITSTVKMK